jgi:serine/threonine protein kinase
LLSAHRRSEGFIDVLPSEAAAELFTEHEDEELLGRSLSHYRVISPLGAGGMGNVYLARDTRLGRRVALKLLPAQSSSDEHRMKRFQQEARAASALNHPSILTVYEIGQQDEHHFIVTEYVEGDTLRHRIKEGPLRIHEAAHTVGQIAGAVAAAHDAGIIHRDIKPENIMVRPDGLVKVLDFGIAKLTQSAPSIYEELTRTEPSLQTETGFVVGTVPYMSPEQLRGQSVDPRTDIFSLGVLLYEIVSGTRPFTGATMTDVLIAILEKEPPPLKVSRELDRIVRKALA